MKLRCQFSYKSIVHVEYEECVPILAKITWEILYTLKTDPRVTMFSVANKYNGYSGFNSCVLPLFWVLMNSSLNSTPFGPKSLFSRLAVKEYHYCLQNTFSEFSISFPCKTSVHSQSMKLTTLCLN